MFRINSAILRSRRLYSAKSRDFEIAKVIFGQMPRFGDRGCYIRINSVFAGSRRLCLDKSPRFEDRGCYIWIDSVLAGSRRLRLCKSPLASEKLNFPAIAVVAPRTIQRYFRLFSRSREISAPSRAPYNYKQLCTHERTKRTEQPFVTRPCR